MTCCLTMGCPCPFCITRNWVRCGGSSQTNGPLGPCLPFWCDPCVVCFYCPQLLLLWLCLPLGLYLALRIDLWVLTGCWLVSYCDAALYWLVDVHCHPPPAVPQDWWALMASAGSVEWTCVGWAIVACLLHWDQLAPANCPSIQASIL